MMRPAFVKVNGPDGQPVARLLFSGVPEGSVRVQQDGHPERVVVLDDLPADWLSQVTRWNVFGRTLDAPPAEDTPC